MERDQQGRGGEEGGVFSNSQREEKTLLQEEFNMQNRKNRSEHKTRKGSSVVSIGQAECVQASVRMYVCGYLFS